MSWDAAFDGRDWNYTHNTSRIIYDVLKLAGIELAERESWWQRLNGMTGSEGEKYLSAIVTGLEADPGKYRAMNPDNGWGNYDDLLKLLREMRDTSAGACCDVRTWWAAG